MKMPLAAVLVGAACVAAAPGVAAQSILSGYGGGGGGDYRSALGRYQGGGQWWGNTSNGYSGASAPIYSNPNARRSGGSASARPVTWVARLQQRSAVPCGNWQRAPQRCRQTTMAWDPSFQSQRAW